MPKRQRKELTPYQQKLLDPRWQKKRLDIFERDEWCCQKCFDGTATLHVHHRYYTRDANPWDYPMEALITLCEACHEEETLDRPIQEKALLQALRQLGLLAPHLEDLAQGFCNCDERNPIGLELLASALKWALQNDGVINDLIERHLEYLREQRLIKKACQDTE